MDEDWGSQALAGKRLLIVGRAGMVAGPVRLALKRAGVVIVGPASSVGVGVALFDVASIDAAILDIRIEGETVFPLAEWLQDAGVPFVFAIPHADVNVAARYGGYRLSGSPAALAEIAKALFAPSENGS